MEFEFSRGLSPVDMVRAGPGWWSVGSNPQGPTKAHSDEVKVDKVAASKVHKSNDETARRREESNSLQRARARQTVMR